MSEVSHRDGQENGLLCDPRHMPPDIAVVLKKWEHNPEGVPTAIQQEKDGSLNYTDVNIWMWLKVILHKKGYVPL